MITVIFHPWAEQELTDAINYYEQQKTGLGLEYLEAVEQVVNCLMYYPEIGAKVRGSIRRLVIPKFPYALLYRVLEEEKIRILAVAHHKRKPFYWSKRK
ncbi:MAG: type II toxin-antitoxin system RelE/ParE family toxin [Sphaerospermopsis sp.]|uniref:type II toxin-antitoxin system RelE/ParE family toxin n=1 Tax=Sphaerospermopsis sp. LEGE 00249 TaxID=1380707 RepID=UPI00164ED27A|nr:type II toxin-antitoxin system RelE/ParE family toxin [Sphaerospermopsis sp. LEGE 00249]MBC5794978.1 type II toxin-antitoxin system RelE/ParE family toxin [Sphaerospermopsis sp. LEGE 00249]MEB3149602.1 type II toxin-antitoxin system RelE/ParE family toxin [Sphaerospermopsis sp.]